MILNQYTSFGDCANADLLIVLTPPPTPPTPAD
jgi:hypothetical protein